jgi:lipoprotein-releasing system ATP-binding protein
MGVMASVGNKTAVLSASGIQKSYQSPTGPLVILDALDLEVERGTVLAILGASGAGKSTLLNVLGTLDTPDSGVLRIGGADVRSMNEAALSRLRALRLGFVFQFHHLLPEFTAMENVMMPLRIGGVAEEEARRRARQALLDVGLDSRWEHMPSQLSGGEAQRVAVARALAPAPELVLADEPSGNLDPPAAAALHELLRSLARERQQTFVVVTHNDRLAAIADRVLVLERGRLVSRT